MHRNSRLKKSNEMHLYADIYLLLNYSTRFGRPWRPSSGVHKTVIAACGTVHTIREAWSSLRYRSYYLGSLEQPLVQVILSGKLGTASGTGHTIWEAWSSLRYRSYYLRSLEQPLVQVILSGKLGAASGTGHTIWEAWSSLWYRSYYLGSLEQSLVQIILSEKQAFSSVTK